MSTEMQFITMGVVLRQNAFLIGGISMILEYKDYVWDKGSKGLVNYKVADKNVSIFQHNSVCPFCNKKIDNVIYSNSKHDTPEWLWGTFDENERVIQCPICGWWEYRYSNQSDAILDGIRASDVEYASSIIKQYKDEDVTIPIEVLREYVLRKPDVIYKIDAHKMEELVRSVFSDFYPDCKVKHFGKTRDGGRDAILIDSEGKQTVIQVKRRQSANATEGVEPVTALLGVSVLEDNLKGCIFVSTADHFSRDAKAFAQKAIDKQKVECFDLIDCATFLEQVNIVRDKLPVTWEKLLKLK